MHASAKKNNCVRKETWLDRLIYPLVPHPEKRVALVIGVCNYQKLECLRNPSHDVALISERLNWAGYQVLAISDVADARGEEPLDKATIETNIDRFLATAENADKAIIHYSGHGMQIDGENFVVPADFDRSKNWRPQLISITELITYIGEWKIGNVNITNLIDAIGKWKSGCD